MPLLSLPYHASSSFGGCTDLIGETITELHFRITAKTGKVTAAIKRLNLIFTIQIRREQSTGAHIYAVCDRHSMCSEVAFSGI